MAFVPGWIQAATGHLKFCYNPDERYRCGVHGTLHDGSFIIDEDDERKDCSVFKPSTADVFKALKMIFYANSECFVRVMGWGKAEEGLLVVMERLETNVYDHFTHKKFNMTDADGSSFDGHFLKDDVCLIIRSMILSYLVAMEKLQPLIDEQGKTTFVVDGKIKWLLIKQNLSAPQTNAALLRLFRTLLDDRVSKERSSFYTNDVELRTYYHPFVLTGIELERFALTLIDRLRHYFKNQKRVTWTRKMRNATAQDVQLVIFRHRYYRDDMLDFVDYLRNFAVHVGDQNTETTYRNVVKDKLALVPPTSQRNFAMRRIFGDDFLLKLWDETENDDYKSFLNMRL